MVEPFDEPGTHDPHAPHEPRPEDDFPADFFEDEPEETSDRPTPAPPPHSPVQARDEGRVEELARPDAPREAATYEPSPVLHSSYPSEAAVPTSEEVIKHHPVFPLVMGLALLGALVGAVAYSMKTAHENAPPTATAVAPAPAPALTPVLEPTPAPALSNEIKEIQTDLADLASSIKELQDKFAAMSKPEPAPDLKPLQTQVADLARSSEAVAPLPKKVDDLDVRVGAVDKSLADLKSEIVALRGEVRKAGEQAAAAATSRVVASSTAAIPAIDEGIRLYKAGKYKDADVLFSKLTATNPDDARVWYFAALSSGFATGQWTGRPVELVLKGIEREKAGTPPSAEIDAAFGDLTKTNGKDWLAYYRKSAIK
jgi:hypothetical protein